MVLYTCLCGVSQETKNSKLRIHLHKLCSLPKAKGESAPLLHRDVGSQTQSVFTPYWQPGVNVVLLLSLSFSKV